MRRLGFEVVCSVLAFALAIPTSGLAQSGLSVQVLSGEGAINNIENRVAVEPLVEVRDAEGRPVAKAVVTFRSPAEGPSVTFFGASRTTTLTTDESGRARAAGMTPNAAEGAFQINVVAEHDGQSAESVINQANAYSPAMPKAKKKGLGWKVLAVITAGAAAGIAAAAIGGGDDAAANPTSVSLGSVSVGAPR